MARTEDTALSALLSALGKGVMQLPVEMEKQKEVQRQNALTGYQMMQQQEQQRRASEEGALRMSMMRLQQQELNEKIRRAAMEPYMTEEQRMAMQQKMELEKLKQQAAYQREQAESVARINQQGKINELDWALQHGVTTSGNNPTQPKVAGQTGQASQLRADKDALLNSYGYAGGATGEAFLQKQADADRATQTGGLFGLGNPFNNADTLSAGSPVGILKQLAGLQTPTAQPIMTEQPQSDITTWAQQTIRGWDSLDQPTKDRIIAKRKKELGLQ